MSRPPQAKSDLLFFCLFVFLQGTFVFISFLRNCICYYLQAFKSDWLFCSFLVACKKVRLRASERCEEKTLGFINEWHFSEPISAPESLGN